MFCNYTGDVHHFIKILVASWKAQHTIPAPGFLAHWHPLSQRSQRTWAWCPPPVAIRHRQLETNAILVGGFNPSEKYESQLGLLFPIYGKIIQMFETTNQKCGEPC